MFRCDQCDNAITPGEAGPFCGASAESQAPLPGEVLVIDMQDRRPPVLRGNHVHTCPECSTHVPCEDACGCFEDMRLDDGTERGGFVICDECSALALAIETTGGRAT